MRNLRSHTETEAERELRADEVLIPAGGITICGYDLQFFAAGSDEDFMPKNYRLEHRRQQKLQKRRQRCQN